MKLKALISFASKEVSAAAGQVFSCSEALADDLLQAGYATKETGDEDQRSNASDAVPSAKRKRGSAK